MDELKLIVIPLAIAIASVALTAYINIKVKFAQDEKSAFRDARAIFFKIALFVTNAWIAYSLFREITSSEPPTRASIFIIVFNSLSLFWFAISYFLLELIEIIKSVVALQGRHFELTKKALDRGKTDQECANSTVEPDARKDRGRPSA